MVYVVKIKKSYTYTLKEIEEYLKTNFKNYDYMMGFLDGYLFDSYKILTLSKFENELNNNFNEEYYIKFVTVEQFDKNEIIEND